MYRPRIRHKDYVRNQPCDPEQLRNPETGFCKKCKSFQMSDLLEYCRKLGVQVHPRDTIKEICDKIFRKVGLEGQNRFDEYVSNLLGIEPVMQQVIQEPQVRSPAATPLGFTDYASTRPKAQPVAQQPEVRYPLGFTDYAPAQTRAQPRAQLKTQPVARPAAPPSGLSEENKHRPEKLFKRSSPSKAPKIVLTPFLFLVDKEGKMPNSPKYTKDYLLGNEEYNDNESAKLAREISQRLINIQKTLQELQNKEGHDTPVTLFFRNEDKDIKITPKFMQVIKDRLLPELIQEGNFEIDLILKTSDLEERGYLRFGARKRIREPPVSSRAKDDQDDQISVDEFTESFRKQATI